MTPKAKNFGLLYSSKTDAAVNTVEQAKNYLESKNIKYTEGAVVEDSEIATTVESLCKKCDAIFIPNDAVMQGAMSTITEIARENKIAVYGSSATMVDSGCLGINNIGMVEKPADLASKYFEGEKVENIPSIVVPYDYVTVNKDDAKAIGINLDSIDFGKDTVNQVNDAKN